MPTVAEGSVEEVIARVLGALAVIAIDIEADCVWTGLLLSFTVTVKFAVPLAVGLPEIAPLLARLSPAGRLPELIDQVYGVVPPPALSVLE